MKSTTKKMLGARIKELRKSRKWSQEKLSEAVHIDPKHLSRIEVGNSYPSLDTLDNLAQALDVEIKDFFEFAHLVKGKELKKRINKLIEETDENKLSLIFKIAKSIIR